MASASLIFNHFRKKGRYLEIHFAWALIHIPNIATANTSSPVTSKASQLSATMYLQHWFTATMYLQHCFTAKMYLQHCFTATMYLQHCFTATMYLQHCSSHSLILIKDQRMRSKWILLHWGIRDLSIKCAGSHFICPNLINLFQLNQPAN